jgi:REP element-mobilizing transposase RayT
VENTHKYWHSRGYLPHCDTPGLLQFITFRLNDALPQDVLKRLGSASVPACPFQKEQTPAQQALQRYKLVERTLDAGYGECLLKRPELAAMVQDALLFGDNSRYRLLRWCVMPNHAHVLIELWQGWPLGKVVEGWKSVTARRINAQVGREGALWMVDYFDRFIRDDRHLAAVEAYIDNNPVKAGLAATSDEWPYSSAAWCANIPVRDAGFDDEEKHECDDEA